jgi:predicted RNA-binding protein associated with RNAse of E/G family
MSLMEAKYKKEYTLSLLFSDGEYRVIDFEPILKKHAVYKKYLKINNFLKFEVDHGALRWPGNILDFHYSYLFKMCIN